MRIQPWLLGGFALLVFAAAFVVYAYQAKGSLAATAPSRIAAVPVIHEGESTTVGALREGRPMVVNSWASWCPYCRTELPDMERLAQEFEGRVGVLAVNRGESDTVGALYLSSLNLQRKVVYVYDPVDAWYRVIGGYVMPETLFIREDGTVQHHQRGVLSFEALRTYTQQLLDSTQETGKTTTGTGKGCEGALCRGEE